MENQEKKEEWYAFFFLFQKPRHSMWSLPQNLKNIYLISSQNTSLH